MTKTKRASKPTVVRFDIQRFRADFEEVMAERRKLLRQVVEETGMSKATVFRFLSSTYHGANAPGISLDTAVKLSHWAMLDLCNYIVEPEER